MNTNKLNAYKMNDKTINAIGPLQERMERDPNVWNEIEHYGEYYYFRIGFYRSVSSEPAPRPGYTWWPIGQVNYMVVDEITLAEFSNTRLCDITSQIMLECNTNDELEDFTQETPVYVKDILTMLLKNHDTLLTVVSTISQRTQMFIEAGKLDKLEASLNVKLVENRIGMNTDIFTELFEMTHPNCYSIGPVSVRLNPSKYWDVVEAEYGKSFYYFRKGYYTKMVNSSSDVHWINLLPHQSIYIDETEYIVLKTDAFREPEADDDLDDVPPPLGIASTENIVLARKIHESRIEAQEKPVEEKPVEEKPIEEKPIEEKPIEEKPIEEKPVEEKPVEEKPVEEKPVEEKPVEEKPVEEKPVEEKPVEEKPVEEKPVVEKPVVEKPVVVVEKPVVVVEKPTKSSNNSGCSIS